jgi:hypothetical protein
MIRYLVALLLFSCGSQTQYENDRTKPTILPELEALRKQVVYLQGTVSQIDAFVANDFADCTTGLPAFETKICQIAQTATAEDRVVFTFQLGEITKVFQNQIYGEDCINATDPGCPVAGSVLDDVAQVEASVATIGTDSAQAQADAAAALAAVTTMQADITVLETRMTGAEAAIVALEAAQVSIESRLDSLEATVSNSSSYRTIQLCADNPDSGPVFEAVLMSGDNSMVTAFITSGAKDGLGVLHELTDGDLSYLTSVNTKKCRFNIYDLTTELKICWDNTDRSATQGSIDTACDSANNFTAPTAACTCK